jgi:hypothetical protein
VFRHILAAGADSHTPTCLLLADYVHDITGHALKLILTSKFPPLEDDSLSTLWVGHHIYFRGLFAEGQASRGPEISSIPPILILVSSIGVPCTDSCHWFLPTPKSRDEYLVMSFRLANAPAHFMYLVNSIFMEEIDKFVMVFIDDILFFSKSKKENEEHLCTTLQRLRDH